MKRFMVFGFPQKSLHAFYVFMCDKWFCDKRFT